MREIISLHVGQAGISTGESCWELLCLEHGFNLDGTPLNDQVVVSEGVTSFFKESLNGVYSPLCLMVDLEPNIIDGICNGKFKNLFEDKSMIYGKEDAANNFARGYFATGNKIIQPTMEALRKLVDLCEDFQGFIIYKSLGGGTGSGFGSVLSEQITDAFPKKSRLEFVYYSGPQNSASIVEPYNAVFASHCLLEKVDVSFIAENEALYNICKKYLDIGRPGFSNLNRLLALIVSSVTASIRFGGPLNCSLTEFQTNLVPFPRVHFPILSYSPVSSIKQARHHRWNSLEMTKTCFEEDHLMVNCNLGNSKYMACCLLYRGDISPTDINVSIKTIKEKLNLTFVDWSPAGFKIGINDQKVHPPPEWGIAPTNQSLCMINNNTAIRDVWQRIIHKFDLMFQKKCFVHWYLKEGMELQFMKDSIQDMKTLYIDYEFLNQDGDLLANLKPGPL